MSSLYNLVSKTTLIFKSRRNNNIKIGLKACTKIHQKYPGLFILYVSDVGCELHLYCPLVIFPFFTHNIASKSLKHSNARVKNQEVEPLPGYRKGKFMRRRDWIKTWCLCFVYKKKSCCALHNCVSNLCLKPHFIAP